MLVSTGPVRSIANRNILKKEDLFRINLAADYPLCHIIGKNGDDANRSLGYFFNKL